MLFIKKVKEWLESRKPQAVVVSKKGDKIITIRRIKDDKVLSISSEGTGEVSGLFRSIAGGELSAEIVFFYDDLIHLVCSIKKDGEQIGAETYQINEFDFKHIKIFKD